MGRSEGEAQSPKGVAVMSANEFLSILLLRSLPACFPPRLPSLAPTPASPLASCLSPSTRHEDTISPVDGSGTAAHASFLCTACLACLACRSRTGISRSTRTWRPVPEKNNILRLTTIAAGMTDSRRRTFFSHSIKQPPLVTGFWRNRCSLALRALVRPFALAN